MINLDVDNESGEPLKHIPRRTVVLVEHDLKQLSINSVLAGCAFTLLVIVLILTLRSSSGTGVMPASDPSFHDVLLDAKDNSVWLRLLDPVPVAAKYSSPTAADPESAVPSPTKAKPAAAKGKTVR